MKNDKRYAFLKRLIETPSPVGREVSGQKVWMEQMKGIADRVEADTYGSAAAHLQTSNDVMTVMLEAHCDEIGMVVQFISEDGYIYLNRLGGSDSTIARARSITIYGRKGAVQGVTGHTAIHMQDKKNGGGKEPAWKEIYVDIGAKSREEALERVQVGDAAVWNQGFEWLSETRMTGRALDNRIGGYAIARVMDRLAKDRSKLKVNVIALNSVQEEVGGYGARMMSYRHQPDVALVTDVTHATDIPGIDTKEHGLVKLGEGPSIQHGGANHPKVVAHVEEVSGAKKIPIQHEATSYRSGTDTDSIFYQRTGIPSALISLPLRYMHSPVETASTEDLEHLIDLMAESVLAMEPSQSFELFD